MSTLAIQNIVRSGNGLDPSYAVAAAGGDEFTNDGKRTFVHALNANGGATRTITCATPKTVAGLAVAELVVVVPISGEAMFGPFPADTFNDGDGKVQMTYDDEADLTLAVIKI